jgi:hypothetical protein
MFVWALAVGFTAEGETLSKQHTMMPPALSIEVDYRILVPLQF